MKFLFATVTAAACVAAQELRCATTGPRRSSQGSILDLAGRSVARGIITVDTYVHLVTTENKSTLYPASQIEAQISLLQEVYQRLGIDFNVISIDHTINDTWATTSYTRPAEVEYKRALIKGTYADLNIYILSDISEGVAGWCEYPVAQPSDLEVVLDGCTVDASTMPNGTSRLYNEGKTLVHEVGHWFDLLHPFQDAVDADGCVSAGDLVDDTPACDGILSGCPTNNPDTCPDQPGLDPIQNYMMYTSDICLEEFTPGQAARMQNTWETLRAPQRNYTAVAAPAPNSMKRETVRLR